LAQFAPRVRGSADPHKDRFTYQQYVI